MPSLPVPSNWAWSGERVAVCFRCGRPDLESRMHVTFEGNLECDRHSIRTAGYLNNLNAESAESASEEVIDWLQTPHSTPSSR